MCRGNGCSSNGLLVGGGNLRYAKIADTKFSGGIARRFSLTGCRECPAEIYVSPTGEKVGWTSLSHQRQQDILLLVIALLVVGFLVALASTSRLVRSSMRSLLSLSRLTKQERRAWKVDRGRLASRDGIDVGRWVEPHIRLWVTSVTVIERISIGNKVRDEAEPIFTPEHLSLTKQQLHDRRLAYGRSLQDAQMPKISFVLWNLIREVCRRLEWKT